MSPEASPEALPELASGPSAADTVSMKRSLVGILVLLVIAAAAAAGAWAFRAHLAWPPFGRSMPMGIPRAAFEMPDGDLVVLEEGGRAYRADSSGILLWVASAGDYLGSIVELDVASDGTVYVLDRLLGDEQRFERIVRLNAEGQPAGVLVQKRFSKDGGFVPGALRVWGDSVYYLYSDDDGLSSLARVNIVDGKEHVIIKTDWALNRASLAAGGPDGAVAIAAAGAVVRYVRGRFELLSELNDDIEYPTEIRYRLDGTLLVADPYLGRIVSLAPDGAVKTVLDQTSLSAAAPKGSAAILDSFSVRGERIALVEGASSAVLVYDRLAAQFKPAPAPVLPESELRLSILAWACAGAAALSALMAVLIALVAVIRKAPVPLAAIAASLPALAALGILALSWARSDALAGAEAAMAERLDALAADAARAAPALPRAALAALDAPDDYASDEYKEAAAALAGIRLSAGDQEPYAVALRRSGGVFRFVVDSDASVRPGLPQRFVLPSYAAALEGGDSARGILRDAAGEWLAAAVPLRDDSGAVLALLELSVPLPKYPVLVVPGQSLARLAMAGGAVLAALACALLAAGVRMRSAEASRNVPDGGLFAAALSGEDGAGRDEPSGDQEGDEAGPPLASDTELHERFGIPAMPSMDDAGPTDYSIPEPDLPEEPAAMGDSGFDLPDFGDEGASQPPQVPEARLPPKLAPPAERPKPAAGLAASHRKAIDALKRGDAGTAAILLEDILAGHPNDPRVLNNLGIAYKRLGRLSDAIRCVRKAVALEPGNANTRANLERLEAAARPGAGRA